MAESAVPGEILVLQCDECKQHFQTLDDFRCITHVCAKGYNTSSSSSTTYKDNPIGPIASLVPGKYHRLLDNETLKSYIAFNESDAQIFRRLSDPADIPVITKRKTTSVYPYILENLTDKGKDAIKEIKDPNVLNVIIDWCSDFEVYICSRPLSDEQGDDGGIDEQKNSDTEQAVLLGDEAAIGRKENRDTELGDEAAIDGKENRDTELGDEEQESTDTEQAELLAQSQDDQGKWSREAVMLLLDTYKSNQIKFSNPRIKKKAVWLHISDVLQSNGFSHNFVRCERKLLNLKSKYKSVRIHNSKSGNDPKSCSFYKELDEIFKKSPAILPVSTCSSIAKNKEPNKSSSSVTPSDSVNVAKKRVVSNTDSQPTASSSKCSRLEQDNHKKEQRSKKVGQSTEEKMLKAINDLSEKEDRRMQLMMQMHTEQMSVTKSFIETIQKAFTGRDNNNNN